MLAADFAESLGTRLVAVRTRADVVPARTVVRGAVGTRRWFWQTTARSCWTPSLLSLSRPIRRFRSNVCCWRTRRCVRWCIVLPQHGCGGRAPRASPARWDAARLDERWTCRGRFLPGGDAKADRVGDAGPMARTSGTVTQW